MSLRGRRAIITGADGSVGSVIVRRFLEEGITLVGVVHGEKDRPRREGLTILRADVTSEDEVARLFATAVKHLGGLDILVNTVGGYAPARPVDDLPADVWDNMMNLNLRSVFLCTREAVRVMRGRGYGRIVNFSAQSAFHPASGKSAYTVSKAGVSVFTEVVAREVMGEGITVNAIAPGIIDTEANRKSMPGEDFSKWVSPEAIAETVCSLCSERNAISGTTLRVYGGLQ